MRVTLLGTAAGGGFPQWNCGCALCARCRRGELPPRFQDSVAVSGNGRDWWLLNASPDIRVQVEAAPALAAGPGPRDTPVRGVLLTDAEVDHSLGLAVLRGGADLTVYAAHPVHQALSTALPLRGLLDRYAPWRWQESGSADRTAASAPFALTGGLTATLHPVGTKAPKYVTEPAAGVPWVSAVRIEDPATGGALLYAPCLATWPDGFDDLLASVSCAVVDGTFFGAEELGRAVRSPDAGQSLMGHLPVSGPGGTLARLARHPDLRRLYTHFNNTNPLLDPSSAAAAEVRDAGVEVPEDGAELTV
ncbi:pyrroloquinoline quinone biosynthesis protein PqqB [Streptomyces catenulae]|uniref:Coenzyme PQQ synthesis protein B n=1 Tax=Streptomyces catenulae TaxID=66875 RepID=A0ABV2Z272_9ACTN|nr:pyrroloquinoline quinone biosynthesis protein PqqB [Streptomyces catenulae]